MLSNTYPALGFYTTSPLLLVMKEVMHKYFRIFFEYCLIFNISRMLLEGKVLQWFEVGCNLVIQKKTCFFLGLDDVE